MKKFIKPSSKVEFKLAMNKKFKVEIPLLRKKYLDGDFIPVVKKHYQSLIDKYKKSNYLSFVEFINDENNAKKNEHFKLFQKIITEGRKHKKDKKVFIINKFIQEIQEENKIRQEKNKIRQEKNRVIAIKRKQRKAVLVK